MSVRLKTEVWKAMPVDRFIKNMRIVLRQHPEVMNSREFAELLDSERQRDITIWAMSRRET